MNKLSDTQLIAHGNSVKEGMTGNAHFPTLVDLVEEHNERLDEFRNAIPHENSRNLINVEAKNQKRKALILVTESLGYAVMSVARNNRELLASSGFALNSITPERRVIPTSPENVEAFITSQPQTIQVTCKADRNARIYKVRASTDRVNWQWTNEGTRAKLLLHDVTAGVIVYVQMAAKNSLGESPWSNATAVRLPLPNEPEVKRANV